ncbi:GNAT family N-acetyltransferase [Mycetocola reblochoni]|uniref:Histone acetyltransferase HPA2 and related acetyltransferases n=2 Tax=Mycetocola reblochoni TaxID=331618 RepID=A0A1R4JMW1_9MICO|nr:GNAT family N-acetyltransferase [Mycetocola reblochoni]RLP68591.1 GNAT family N-acetyltransferase [Mycetocola reblochoni]SJN33327.1 Histone acetyltransferase HPA2 and related acetyltransferases [Mycetocola reblochoni REB411]
MTTPLRIDSVAWDDPDATSLRAAQRAELDSRYGNDDHEYGAAPTADSVSVFLVARAADGSALGCGGLRPLGDGVVELKRMYVVPESRGRGVAVAVLRALESAARAEGATRMLLEAGDRQPEAIRLYEREGYRRIERFGAYADDPHSICFERVLSPAEPSIAAPPPVQGSAG